MKNLTVFLDDFFGLVAETGIDVTGYELDHPAYQASSSDEYDQKVEEFKEISDLVHEAIINGRRVGVFELHEPIKYKDFSITALEILEPREGKRSDSGWEHAEFVIDGAYEDLMSKHPELEWDTSSADRPIYSHLKLRLNDLTQLKFHKMNILDTIELEKNQTIA